VTHRRKRGRIVRTYKPHPIRQRQHPLPHRRSIREHAIDQDRGGERWFYVDADGRAGHTRKPRPADLLAEGVVSFSFPSMGGTFQLRRVDGRHAVRWIPAE
jgi:hypothetical protein